MTFKLKTDQTMTTYYLDLAFYLTVNYILNNPAGWMILNLVFLYVIFFFPHLDLVHLDGLDDEQYACSVVLFLHGVLLG